LMRDHLIDVNRNAEKALEGLKDPVERLRAFIDFHGSYHMCKRREVYINNFELRNLEPKNYALITALRSLHEKRLKEILDEGVAKGIFETADTRVASFAILAMLTGGCVWYRPNGPLGKQQILDIYQKMILEGLLVNSLRVRVNVTGGQLPAGSSALPIDASRMACGAGTTSISERQRKS
jgi:hypothetical protein